MLDMSFGMLASGIVISAVGLGLLVWGKRQCEPAPLVAGIGLNVLPLVMHSVGMLWLASAGVVGGLAMIRKYGGAG
ncbi:MAG: hypothetical protein H6811_01700 [Phycisphaeraceae bacterium]|nr:hypothetical protein [Phycisphaeraceae bacterium]